jgi:hypothetical protein
MSLEDTIRLDEAIAQAEGLVTFAEWYWRQASEDAYWDEIYRKFDL